MDIAVGDPADHMMGVVLRSRFDTTVAIPPKFRRPPWRRRSRRSKSAISASIRCAANGMGYERRDGRNRPTLQFVEWLATSH